MALAQRPALRAARGPCSRTCPCCSAPPTCARASALAGPRVQFLRAPRATCSGSQGPVAVASASGGKLTPRLGLSQPGLVVDLAGAPGDTEAKDTAMSSCDDEIRSGKFVIEADELVQMAEEEGCSTADVLRSLVEPARSLARPPISSFNVGCVGLGASGRAYIGVNLEFARLPLNNSVHAEQFMMMNALHHNEPRIDLLAVSAAPCGHCRQFFCETANSDDIRFYFGDAPPEGFGLADLLPQRFGPRDLIEEEIPLLLEPRDNGIVLSAAAIAQMDALAEASPLVARAAQEALKEANRSYAPYSECPSGLALVTADGDVYSGPYVESAAYNPSMAPLQTAMIDAVVDGMPCYTEVVEVVLVELGDEPHVEHASTTTTKLGKIAPHARLTVLEACRQ